MSTSDHNRIIDALLDPIRPPALSEARRVAPYADDDVVIRAGLDAAELLLDRLQMLLTSFRPRHALNEEPFAKCSADVTVELAARWAAFESEPPRSIHPALIARYGLSMARADQAVARALEMLDAAEKLPPETSKKDFPT